MESFPNSCTQNLLSERLLDWLWVIPLWKQLAIHQGEGVVMVSSLRHQRVSTYTPSSDPLQASITLCSPEMSSSNYRPLSHYAAQIYHHPTTGLYHLHAGHESSRNGRHTDQHRDWMGHTTQLEHTAQLLHFELSRHSRHYLCKRLGSNSKTEL